MGTFYVAGVDLGGSPDSWDYSADGTTTITGTCLRSTLGELIVCGYQLKGILENPDEASGVAIVPSHDSTLAGFYRVLDGDYQVSPPSYKNYWSKYRLRVQRVLPVVAPQIESRILGAVRTNTHNITTGLTVPWWVVPQESSMEYVYGASTGTRRGEDGTGSLYYSLAGTLLYDTTRTWTCPAGDYYKMAARFEVTPDGVNWERLPGLQVGAANPASSFGWRLNNGLVRIVYGGAAGLLSVQHYTGSAWTTAKIYKVTHNAAVTTLGDFKAITLLRNSPEEVTIRLGLEQSAGAEYKMNLDLTLRRGARWIEGILTRDDEAGSADLGVYRNVAEAATAHTSGVHATAADASGGKYILTTSRTKVNDLTTGGFYSTTPAGSAFDFMIGYEPSSAATADTFTNQVYAYFAATTETARLARR